MRKFEFNKLVRNKLPARMNEEGIVVNSTKLNHDQYIAKLKEKLLEEAREVGLASNLEEIKVEIADALEVIYALAKAYKFKSEDIEQERIKKQEINGYFDSDSYINYIEVAENNIKVINYLENKYRTYKLEY